MFRVNAFIFAFVAFIIVQQGCIKDTCNDEPTFSELRASLLSSDSLAVINVSWNVGKQLPKEYFEEIFTYESDKDRFGNDLNNSAVIIDTVVVNSNQDFDILFTENALEDVPKSFDFYFIFPDRRDYIDCTHIGSDDEYELELSFTITTAGDSLKIENLVWEENLYKGPI